MSNKHIAGLISLYLVAAIGFVPVSTAPTTYTNPVFWEDLADVDVFRVNDTYYYSASTMAFSPGAPILRSSDLINWEFVGHSVPTLSFNDPAAYNLEDGRQAYVKGVYASSLRYRASTDSWYWIGCVDYAGTYIYSASDPTAEWDWSQLSTHATTTVVSFLTTMTIFLLLMETQTLALRSCTTTSQK